MIEIIKQLLDRAIDSNQCYTESFVCQTSEVVRLMLRLVAKTVSSPRILPLVQKGHVSPHTNALSLRLHHQLTCSVERSHRIVPERQLIGADEQHIHRSPRHRRRSSKCFVRSHVGHVSTNNVVSPSSSYAPFHYHKL